MSRVQVHLTFITLYVIYIRLILNCHLYYVKKCVNLIHDFGKLDTANFYWIPTALGNNSLLFRYSSGQRRGCDR